MPGERRLTSIKQLINDMLFNANLTGTITVDEITNTVTVQLVEPVTIDGTINIGTLPAVVASVTSLPNVTIADIVNLNVDSIPPLTGSFAVSSIAGTVATNTTITNNPLNVKESLTALTFPTQTTVNVGSVDILLLAANANRKYLMIRNYSNSNVYVFIHFSNTAATLGAGIPLKQEEQYEFPSGFIYTGEIRAISSTATLKEIHITEGV